MIFSSIAAIVRVCVHFNIHFKIATLFFNKSLQVKRAVTKSPAREPYNANKQSSYVELVIVVDNDVYKEMNENLDKIHKYCKDIANIINSVS